jgi:uncharacterized membrane-anchored protein
MVFDPSINLGHILSFIGLVGAVALGFAALKGRLGAIEISSQRQTTDINDIKADLKALNNVVIQVATQNQRIDNMGDRVNRLESRVEKRWDELRRGEGLITAKEG